MRSDIKYALIILILTVTVFKAYSQQKRFFLVAGQSNAQGMGDSLASDTIIPGSGFQYLPSSGFVDLKDPVGFTIPPFIKANTGSAWPAFVRKYHELTGDTIYILATSRESTRLTPIPGSPNYYCWDSTGALFMPSVNYARTIINNHAMNIDGLIWIQGESDANFINNGTVNSVQYRNSLHNLIKTYRRQLRCDLPFFIVETGNNSLYPVAGYDSVRQVQRDVVDSIPGVYMCYDSTVFFPSLGLMNDHVHYNQPGYNRLGKGIASYISQLLASVDESGLTDIKDTIADSYPFVINAGDGNKFITVQGESQYFQVDSAGLYDLVVRNKFGCLNRDTFRVSISNTISDPEQETSNDMVGEIFDITGRLLFRWSSSSSFPLNPGLYIIRYPTGRSRKFFVGCSSYPLN